MDIKVSGRKTTVTDALRAHVDEKIGEARKVFDIEPMTVDVVLRYEKNPSNPNPAIVEVTVRARGSVIRVAEHGVVYADDLRVAALVRDPTHVVAAHGAASDETDIDHG